MVKDARRRRGRKDYQGQTDDKKCEQRLAPWRHRCSVGAWNWRQEEFGAKVGWILPTGGEKQIGILFLKPLPPLLFPAFSVHTQFSNRTTATYSSYGQNEERKCVWTIWAFREIIKGRKRFKLWLKSAQRTYHTATERGGGGLFSSAWYYATCSTPTGCCCYIKTGLQERHLIHTN